MGKSRDIADSAAKINFIDNLTSDVQSQLDTLDPLPSQSGQSGKYLTTDGSVASWGTVTTDPTLGTLTKTFTAGESSTINLASSVLAPVVSVIKEVPQSGVTNNNWDVNSTTENYTRLNSAYATTLTPSSTGDGTFTLGTGSFDAADVGKTIYGNSGVAVIIAADGSYVTTTDFADTSAIASGSWGMYGVVYNVGSGDLELSGYDNAFNISVASYDSVSFSTSSQDTGQRGLAFSSDGTKMFVVGLSNDAVYEYTLSTAFDVSTATYVDSFSVASEETVPSDIAFNTNGTKMFVLGDTGNDVNEYTLSTAFDVSTASFVDSFSVASQETSPQGIAFSTDGTKMFVVGLINDAVYEYTLSVGFDISTASYSQSFSVADQESAPYGMAFNNTGEKMFILGAGGDDVTEYILSTGFDISTAVFSGVIFSTTSENALMYGFCFNKDGAKMYALGNGGTVYQYSTGETPIAVTGYQPVHTTASIDSTYWTDINSMTADQAAGDGNVYYAISTDDRTTWTVIDNTDGERDIVRNNAGTWQYNSNGTYASETWVNGATNTELATLAEAMEGVFTLIGAFDVSTSVFVDSFSVEGQESAVRGIAFSADGTKMFICGISGDDVNEYTLSTAFDVSTASFVDSFSVIAQVAAAAALAFSTDGTKMFVTDSSGSDVNQYTLSVAFDVSSASFAGSFSVSAQDAAPTGIAFNSDGTKMFILGYNGDNVSEYTLSTGFDVSTASFVDSFNTSAQDTLPSGLAFNTNGTKMFIGGQAGDDVNEYTLSTGFDVSTASFVDSLSVTAQDTSPLGIAFNTDGTKMFILGAQNDAVYEYSLGSIDYPNQMDKTQLDAVTDPNHIALGDDLDLAIIFNMDNGAIVPSSDGVAINYDANVLNKGAVLGTDYDFDAPAGDKARITALTAGNFKVRVV